MSFIFISVACSDRIFMCVTHRSSVKKKKQQKPTTNKKTRNPKHTQHPVIEQLCGFYTYVGNVRGSLSQNFLSPQ